MHKTPGQMWTKGQLSRVRTRRFIVCARTGGLSCIVRIALPRNLWRLGGRVNSNPRSMLSVEASCWIALRAVRSH